MIFPLADDSGAFELSDEHRMLLRMRDTLYEGSWEDFERDLRARMEGRPHVFDTVPATPGVKATIANHLRMMEAMREWEALHGRRLSGELPP